jgi:uncharacterized membrane protein YhdT
MACLLVPLLFILLCWAMVNLSSAIFLWRTTMQLEVIILIAYLVVVFGLSSTPCAENASGSFLNEYFSAAARWAALCWP